MNNNDQIAKMGWIAVLSIMMMMMMMMMINKESCSTMKDWQSDIAQSLDTDGRCR